MTPDINVLLAASRSDHPHHKRARAWLTQAVAACETGARLEILPMVAAGFLRLATHPKVFVHPTPVAAAAGLLHALLQIPGVEMPPLGREWPVLRRLCCDRNLSGNWVSDAWIAAAVRVGNGHLVTFDRDFARLLDKSELTLLEV
ncbi:MAG: PIN domain-containing protein [Nevskia sp.]|nr:PIN domain-containing protein [Nevskia sp.]